MMKAGRLSNYPFLAAGFLAVLYALAAKLGLMMDAVSGFASLVWPPTGIALAALLLFGSHLWPGIALGAFAANLWNGAPLLVAAGIGFGNTLEALVGFRLLKRVGFYISLGRVRDVVALAVLAAGISTTVSATAGVVSLYLGGIVSVENLGATWRAWWLGDLTGAVVIAPLVLTWASDRRLRAGGRLWAEAMGLAALLVSISLFIFGRPFGTPAEEFPKAYWLLPPLLWAAIRFGPRGAATSTFLVSVIAIWGAAMGFGPFARKTLHETLFHFQGFMAVVTVTTLALAAVIAERWESDRAVRKSHALLQAVAEGTTDAVFVKDLQGRYLLINSAGASAFRLPVEEVVGKYDAELLPPALALPLVERDREVMDTGEVRSGEEVIAVDGKPRTFFSTKGPYRDQQGRILGVIGIARDITERKEAEEALRRQKDELERSNAELQQFSYAVSHDLREPLRAIAGYAALLERRSAAKLDPASLRHLEQIGGASRRMEGIITDLLAYARTGQAGQRLEIIDTSALVDGLLRDLKPLIQKSRATVLHGNLPVVAGYRTPLRAVFQNLIVNAIKYAAKAKDSCVEIGAASQDRFWYFTVKDNGPGIPPEYHDLVFKLFQRIPGAEAAEGTGIGLAIARKAVEQHGGKIWVESDGFHGSTFCFLLPAIIERGGTAA